MIPETHFTQMPLVPCFVGVDHIRTTHLILVFEVHHEYKHQIW